MTFGSLFSGIGGFDGGLEAAGMECVWQVENNPACQKVLARHWPNVRRHGDVNGFTPATEPVRPDLICGGFPCQDLSVAGKRAGLAGDRSGLFHRFKAILAVYAPDWVLVENVPGLLSSGCGRDMGTVLGSLAELGYGFAYRILDAQWFGVPQRRRRVFIVGCVGDWRRAAEVLFERESLPWNSPPSREAGAGVAHCLARSACGSHGRYDPNGEDYIIEIRNSGSGGNRGYALPHEPSFTVDCGGPQGWMSGKSVRRLTPRECERLQGFPDDWTRWDAEGNELKDGPRYKMLGNAVAVPVAEWIGRRIMSCEATQPALDPPTKTH